MFCGKGRRDPFVLGSLSVFCRLLLLLFRPFFFMISFTTLGRVSRWRVSRWFLTLFLAVRRRLQLVFLLAFPLVEILAIGWLRKPSMNFCRGGS